MTPDLSAIPRNEKGIEITDYGTGLCDEQHFTPDGDFIKEVVMCVTEAWNLEMDEEVVLDLMRAGF